MPAPTLMDLGSGMDTRGTIKKLLELERIPIQRLQKKNQLNEIRISAWQQVRRRTKELENRSRNLHSFSGAFAINSVRSSDPGAITGQAAPEVDPGKQQIEVKALATHHALHSDSLPIEELLPAGKFVIEVDGKKIDFSFNGGKPRALLNFLKSRARSILDANAVKVDAEHLMIALRSKKSGKKGEIRFSDPDGLLKKIGLIGSVETEENATEIKKAIFDKKKIKIVKLSRAPGPPEAQAFEVLDSGKSLRLTKDVVLHIPKKLSSKAKLKLSYALSARPETKEPVKESRTTKPEDHKKKTAIEVGPKIEIEVGDVRLRGYNLKRSPLERTKPRTPPKNSKEDDSKKAPATLRIGLSWLEDGKVRHAEVQKMLPANSSEKQEGLIELSVETLTGGKAATAIRIENENGTAVLSALSITEEVKKKVTKAKNETTPARDALISINGVDVKRPKNQGLTDIIEGVSLDLNRTTNGPVTVSIETRSDEIIKEIEAWVKAYNDLLVFCRELSRNAKNDLKPEMGPDGRPVVDRKQSGIFASDSTIRQLMVRIRMTTARSFPIVGSDGYRVLADIGISTGALGQDWADIKTGLLTLDKEKLRDALARNPEGVRNLFASDTNEDNIKDDGLAIKMVHTLKPYNQRAGGLITARIQMLRDRIKANKDDMYRKELALKNKEDSLRRRFGYMERAVKRNRSIGEYLNRQNRQRD